jgi:S-DNA-T family DNA segregation ATPase FtsK/SpoIIIE
MGKKTSGTYSFLTGTILLVLGVMLLSSLLSFQEEDIGFLREHEGNVANAFGALGAWIAHWFFSNFGVMVPWPIGILLLGWSWNRYARRPTWRFGLQTLYCVCLLCVLAVGLALLPGLSRDGARHLAGSFGLDLADRGRSLLGSFGATTISWGLFAVLILIAAETGLVPGLRYLGYVRKLWVPIRWLADFIKERTRTIKINRAVERENREPEKKEKPVKPKVSPAPQISGSSLRPRPPRPAPVETKPVASPRQAQVEVPFQGKPSGDTGAPFSLPPLSLLDEPSGPETYMSKEELLESSKMIEERLANFGVTGRIVEVHPGPVITRFDFEPGAGITVNQIASRADDLALGLKVSRIRLLTPVPGKAAVGIEVPNREPSVVYIRELLSAKGFASEQGSLVLALGKDTMGGCFYTELSRMPHLLIAGATGSGKSVCINSVILSMLFRLSPRELNLLMIDPKKLELTSYNGTPHLITPVISDAREASKSLKWVVKEMERRYVVLASKGVRNVESFNERAREDSLEELPFLVVIIDELADLMCMLPTEIEEPIARLAQMARAVGIHLILATQRPSVDVITGVIKANFPTRIAFQVASKVDSRTILDMNGAETLLGSGDMLFLPAGRAEPQRLHGAYVSEKEVGRIVSFLKEYKWMGKPPIDLREASLSGEGEQGDDDELLEEAVRVVLNHRHGSVSLLQRRLKIGYSRAARLMDRMEEIGIVGPADGSKPRDVLVDDSFLEEGGLFEKKIQG